MPVGADKRYYGEAKVQNFDGAVQAREKLEAKAEGKEYKAPDPAKTEVVDEASHPAASALTVAETQEKPKRGSK